MPIALIVHGGAGAIAAHRQADARRGCATAARLGWDVLLRGGAAIDAVLATMVALEDDPTFNAGTGAVLTADGHAELDAGIMDGATLGVGAVAGLRRVRNPIVLARAVLTSPQVLLLGDGAEALAAAQGIPFVEPQHFIAAYQRKPSQPMAADTGSMLDGPGKHGTVGAVALDAHGHIVAAASTGGYHGKPAGRVGDTPIAGAGFYAEDGVGGISATGDGEAFIRLLAARRVAEALGQGLAAQAATERVIAQVRERVGGTGGLIAIDAAGRVGFARSTANMSYAYLMEGMTEPEAGI